MPLPKEKTLYPHNLRPLKLKRSPLRGHSEPKRGHKKEPKRDRRRDLSEPDQEETSMEYREDQDPREESAEMSEDVQMDQERIMVLTD